MSEYLIGVTGTVLLCGLLTAILPEGKTAGVIKGATKLACLLAIVAPIFSHWNGDKQASDFLENTVLKEDEAFIQYYGNMRIDKAEEALQEEIWKRYSVKVFIEIEADGNAVALTVSKIIARTDENVSDEVKKMVCEYLTNNYCSEVLIE